MSTATPEQHTFQAEVGQLLDIVTHSLYTDKEIFIRELISNASDALEKLRHTQLTEKTIFDDGLDLEINITTDDTAGTITIQDFGIGMSREELAENLGTIAHSGSKAFAQALQAAKEAEAGSEVGKNLIGQFGVGFYSAFMVADEVKVYTRSWRENGEHLIWTSDGKTGYTVEETEGQRRGAKIVIKLKEDAKEYAQAERVKGIVKRYSAFVQFPVNINGERVNTQEALWMKSKNDITEEEYKEFYKFQADAFDEPLFHLHFSADAPIVINSLLYVPSSNPEALGFGKTEPGVALHCRKILIDSKPEGLFPDWLRFLKGVVDSADLPLNISRETMQDSALVRKIRQVLTKRFIKRVEEEAKKNPDNFEKFYKEFQIFLKEGLVNDFEYREQLSKLLRYESSLTEPGKLTSLQDYVDRMKEEQKAIYFLYAPNRQAIENGPYLEAFKARNLEVIFVYEGADEYVLSQLGKFAEKDIKSGDASDLDLGDAPEAEGEPLSEEESKALCEWIKETLGDKAQQVQIGKRLVGSPVVALNANQFMTPAMRRMMQQMNQEGGGIDFTVNLEINPRHGLIKSLSTLKDSDADTAKLVTEQLYDNALISAGFLDDPRTMINRMNQLLEKVAKG